MVLRNVREKTGENGRKDTGQRVNETGFLSKADFDEVNVESIMAGNTDVSPKNTSFINATTKPITKKATQI